MVSSFIPRVLAISDVESYLISPCNSTSNWLVNHPPTGCFVSVTNESEERGHVINYTVATSILGDATFFYDPPNTWNWSSMGGVSFLIRYNGPSDVRLMIFDSEGRFRHWDFSLDTSNWTEMVLFFDDFTVDKGVDLSEVTRIQFGCQALFGQQVELLIDDLCVGKGPRFYSVKSIMMDYAFNISFAVAILSVYIGSCVIHKKRNSLKFFLHDREKRLVLFFLLSILAIEAFFLVGWSFLVEILSVFLFLYLVVLIAHILIQFQKTFRSI